MAGSKVAGFAREIMGRAKMRVGIQSQIYTVELH